MSNDLATTVEIEEFLHCALVSWLELYLPKPEILPDYVALLDGTIIHSVWQRIDTEASCNLLPLAGIEGVDHLVTRMKNFNSIIQSISEFYSDNLGQIVLILPDCYNIGYRGETKAGLENMKLLLKLLLGAAVQCAFKEDFIEKIKELDMSTQHELVKVIKQIVDDRNIAVCKDRMACVENSDNFDYLKSLAKKRDSYYINLLSVLTNAADVYIDQNEHSWKQFQSELPEASSSPFITSARGHHHPDIKALKAKLRELQQELAEKSDANIELRIELGHKIKTLEKLQAESQEWYAEAKRAVAYRDEVDALRERAERADHLEIELQRTREKLLDLEFYKTRIEELREDNRVLTETKKSLEDQLCQMRKRCEQVTVLESQVILCRQKLEDVAMERGVEKCKLTELVEENIQLQLATKVPNTKVDLDSSDYEVSIRLDENTLSEQLRSSMQAKLLAAELENAQLLAENEMFKGVNSKLGALQQRLENIQDNFDKLLERHENSQESTETDLESDEETECDVTDGSTQNGIVDECDNLIDAIAEEFDRSTRIINSELIVNSDMIEVLRKDFFAASQKAERITNNLKALGINCTIFCGTELSSMSSPASLIENHEAWYTFLKSIQSGQCNNQNCRSLTDRLRTQSDEFSALQHLNSILAGQKSALETKVNQLVSSNSQLILQKETLLEQIENLKQNQKILVRDLNRLRRQHERLQVDFETANKDRDLLKRIAREMKNENIDLKNRLNRLEKSQMEDMAILRAEHSKLSDDFGKLYATCEQYRGDYETLQSEYDLMRAENEHLKHQIGECSLRIERLVNTEMDQESLTERCEMLLQMNANLTRERRVLMDNVSQLLAQYHQLLSHSLEDKKQYHEAEQILIDQVSMLNRQKERLEMKIMDQYKTPDSGGQKKKENSNSLIKRMKKASSDLISKVPSRSRKSWAEDSSTTPSKIQQDSESISPESEHTSEPSEDIHADCDSNLMKGYFADPDDCGNYQRNSLLESSDEPNSLDLLEARYRKPIYRAEKKI